MELMTSRIKTQYLTTGSIHFLNHLDRYNSVIFFICNISFMKDLICSIPLFLLVLVSWILKVAFCQLLDDFFWVLFCKLIYAEEIVVL